MNPIKHVAIIMDGNGRWGIKNKKSRNLGHREGLSSVEKIIKQTIKKKIKHLTLYAFSTENWKRPKKEVNFLFNLLYEFLGKKINTLNEQGIKFSNQETSIELINFLRERIKNYLKEKKIRYDIIEAAISSHFSDDFV